MLSFSDADLEEIQKIKEKVSDGYRLRIDVGLSDSMPHTIRWTRYDPRVIVIGFEPNRTSFDKCVELRQQVSREDRIFLFNYALTNTSLMSELQFYEMGGPTVQYNVGTSSLLAPRNSWKSAVQKKTFVKGVPAKAFLDLVKPNLIDLVKVDTQGYDLEVLRGFGDYLSQALIVIAECDSTTYYEGANSRKELEDFFRAKGFSQVRELFSRGSDAFPSDFIFRNSVFEIYPYFPSPIYYYFNRKRTVMSHARLYPLEFLVAFQIQVRQWLAHWKWKLREVARST